VNEFPGSRFFESLTTLNNLADRGFAAWVFYPGMKFGDRKNWWGEKGRRARPHEGIDLCFYRDSAGGILRVNEGLRVPAAFDGVVLKIIDDFLGKSIIVEHRLPSLGGRTFLTIYGHTTPRQGLDVGEPVREGEVIASLTGTGRSPQSPPLHLHLTFAKKIKPVPHEALDWATIGDPSFIELRDPLRILNGQFMDLDKWERV
jgi:murein DD-endopeptidase MepM/ murein hydrolase activator NlpD